MSDTATEALRTHQATLIATAERELDAVASVVLGDRFASLRKAQTRDQREYFVLEDAQGGEASLWLDAVPMETGALARTVTNTTSDQYVVHVSDRLPGEYLPRVLAHEVGELIAVRDRSSQGLAPVRESLLHPEADISSHVELSSQDHGRIGELNWLATRFSDTGLSEPLRAEARADFSALVDECGLRPLAAMDEAETYRAQLRAANRRRYASKPFLSKDSQRLVKALARPIEQLDPADATALQASRDAALRAQRQVEAFVGRRDVSMPMPGYDQNGLPLPRDGLESVAEQWAAYRAQVSEGTVRGLEGQLAAGQLPRRRVVIGGGASLAGRDPDALLVDGVGRWHLDPGEGIVQSADQDRDLAQWMGVDPYGTVDDPRRRVPIEAVRIWEDHLATQGDVVNGHARLRLGPDGELFAEVRPFDQDGTERATPLCVACDGVPSIATGLTPEVVPGMPRRDGPVESRSEAVRLIGDRLRELEGRQVAGAREMRDLLVQAERGGADARTVLGALEDSPWKETLKAGLDGTDATRIDNCFTALAATREWEAAREAAPGRALLGDEVAESRFDPHAAQHWIVAGSGGTGVANAEIILLQNPEARVTIVGSDPPLALTHQVQYPKMLEDYGEKGDGRLTFRRCEVGAIETYQDENGRTCFRVPYEETDKAGNTHRGTVEADGYITSLGRTNPLPPALQELAGEVRDRGGQISGDLLFDRDDQYIGYGLTFSVEGREHRVDVDGAASWQLPREVFPPESGIQRQLNAMGARGLPAETGNAAPGFAPIARQSALRARAVAAAQEGDAAAVQRRSTVPERWRRPEAGTETARPAGGPENPPPSPERATGADRDPRPAARPTQAPDLTDRNPATRQPPQTPDVAEQGPKAPTPRPSPAAKVPGSDLWLRGVPTDRPGRSAAPAQQPQQLPPDHQRPGPGVGMGD
ncbi:hypothetical protein GCM10010260_48120 [Streptomyces filipinensis]|uniref:Uncharacterized protein n=1 Tax=Streptomyces filipinensis TaxID=66887 RepID=A0A918IE45_9ACTN|nr:hypothetical protein [Streptomyces filipinensis]GGV05342.1 hypothetical protein GCM10010260_48120 [Streptomyces filipinensis]